MLSYTLTSVHYNQQHRVTNWLSRRYKIALGSTSQLVSAAYSTAHSIKLDPLLVLSVIGIESRFNPVAKSIAGAEGLMQVMSKIHHKKFEKLGGIEASMNPIINIKVGSMILKDYIKRGGSIKTALKMYVGAAHLKTDGGYASKVLTEYNQLKRVATGTPIFPATSKNMLALAKRPAHTHSKGLSDMFDQIASQKEAKSNLSLATSGQLSYTDL